MIRFSLAILLALAALVVFGTAIAARLETSPSTRSCELFRSNANRVFVRWGQLVSISFTHTIPCPNCKQWLHSPFDESCPLNPGVFGRGRSSRQIPTFQIRRLLWYYYSQDVRHTRFRLLLSPWLLVALLAAYPMVYLVRVIRGRIPPGHCAKCSYNLTGNTSGVCPECGTPTVPRP